MFPSFRFHLSWISMPQRTPCWPQLQLLQTKWVKKLPQNPVLRYSAQLLGARRPHRQPRPLLQRTLWLLSCSPGCPLPWLSSCHSSLTGAFGTCCTHTLGLGTKSKLCESPADRKRTRSAVRFSVDSITDNSGGRNE